MTALTAIPSRLFAPATATVAPPVETKHQELPFHELTWENFERLCLRLAERDGAPEHCQQYGQRGQAQSGIDVYARLPSEEFVVYQARRVSKVTAAGLRSAVSDFERGGWYARSVRMVYCTSASMSDTRLLEVAEELTARLRKKGKQFRWLDLAGLSGELKSAPDLVMDFFGRNWAAAFCPPDSLAKYGDRLDVEEAQRLRLALAKFYGTVFSVHDAGALLLSNGGQVAPLEERFVVPEIAELRIVQTPERGTGSSGAPGDHAREHGRTDDGDGRLARSFHQTLELDEWLGRGKSYCVVGGPGSGKSSALRFLALDLLREEPRFLDLARKWRGALPIWVPFGYWVGRAVTAGEAVPLSSAVRAWLASFDEARLWPLVEAAFKDERLVLLVDGLDEWMDASSARITFERLQVFAAQRDVPLVATSRPGCTRQLRWSSKLLDDRLAVADAREPATRVGSPSAEIMRPC